MHQIRNPALFFVGIVLTVMGIALGVYYLIPTIPHILVAEETGTYYMHPKHAAYSFALAIMGIIIAVIAGRKRKIIPEYKTLYMLFTAFQSLPSASGLELRLSVNGAGSLWTKYPSSHCVLMWTDLGEGLEHLRNFRF